MLRGSVTKTGDITFKERKNKYKNTKVVIDNIEFDSIGEGSRYNDLKLMQKGGLICQLTVHRKWAIVINNIKICSYESDFDYRVEDTGVLVVEDYKKKATRTQVFAIKKKLMRAWLNIDVQEVG